MKGGEGNRRGRSISRFDLFSVLGSCVPYHTIATFTILLFLQISKLCPFSSHERHPSPLCSHSLKILQ